MINLQDCRMENKFEVMVRLVTRSLLTISRGGAHERVLQRFVAEAHRQVFELWWVLRLIDHLKRNANVLGQIWMETSKAAAATFAALFQIVQAACDQDETKTLVLPTC